MQMSASVSVVLLNYNSWRDTTECLESLLRSSARSARIVVVDNCSSDDSVARLRDWASGAYESRPPEEGPAKFHGAPPSAKPLPYDLYICSETSAGVDFGIVPPGEAETRGTTRGAGGADLSILCAERNGGFAYGCNLGLAFLLRGAPPKWALLLNNDTVVEPDFLDRLLEEASADPSVGMATGLVRRFHDPDDIWYAGGRLDAVRGVVYHHREEATGTVPVSFASGCFMLIRASVLDELGLLDARYFLGVEDWEYSYRVTTAGWKILFVHASVIYHKVGASSGGEQSPLSAFYATLGRRRFICQSLPPSRRPFALAYFFLTRCIRAGQHLLHGEHRLAGALLRAMFAGEDRHAPATD